MKTHKLRIEQEYLEEIKSGNKKSEIRLNDRDYQKGDLIYYNFCGKKCYGIIDKIVGKEIWAYWQVTLGDTHIKEFKKRTGYILIKKCTLEPDWSKIKGLKNIPKIANVPRAGDKLYADILNAGMTAHYTKKPRKWTVDTTVKSDDGIEVSKNEIKVLFPKDDSGTFNLGIKEAKNLQKQLRSALEIHKRYFNK